MQYGEKFTQHCIGTFVAMLLFWENYQRTSVNATGFCKVATL